jgi:hypothetical protein
MSGRESGRGSPTFKINVRVTIILNKTLPMIENLSVYWDKADGKTKQKILGCIFTEKFENFDFESCNNIFTPEIESIMLASKVLKGIKKKKRGQK